MHYIDIKRMSYKAFSGSTSASMKFELSYDVASGSEITPCNKID